MLSSRGKVFRRRSDASRRSLLEGELGGEGDSTSRVTAFPSLASRILNRGGVESKERA